MTTLTVTFGFSNTVFDKLDKFLKMLRDKMCNIYLKWIVTMPPLPFWWTNISFMPEQVRVQS